MATRDKKVVTIIGGGGSAHVLIPFLSGAGLEVNILTRRPEEWSHDVELQLQSIHEELLETFKGSLTKISDNPAEVIPQADVIVLCMPVCKYRSALHNLAPHLDKNRPVFIGTIYGQAGFNWMVREIEQKFDALAEPVLTDDARKRLKDAVWGLENMSSISDLMALCKSDK